MKSFLWCIFIATFMAIGSDEQRNTAQEAHKEVEKSPSKQNVNKHISKCIHCDRDEPCELAVIISMLAKRNASRRSNVMMRSKL